MARLRSKMPAWDELDQEKFRYLEDLDRRVPAMADLSPSATAAEAAADLNALKAALRTAGIMEE
jgi:hypothetical protein